MYIVSVIVIVSLFLLSFIPHLYANKRNRKKKKTYSKDKDPKLVSVEIPEEKFSVVECMYEDKPSIVVVNSSLRGFKNKDVFSWTCSLSIEFKDLANKGMPTSKESNLVFDWFVQLDSAIKGDPKHPNALFLARETCDGFMNAYWQVHNPEPVNQYLQTIIQGEKYPREMEYKIEQDIQWKKVEWFLQDFSKKENRCIKYV
ncbi:MAG: DUF695 domain-containing protein [Paludibacteraceae bacterium]|nr:DUF695 domain-containing protein [Paludibacteraceae bacterium]